jgi:anti-anti-sigma factor
MPGSEVTTMPKILIIEDSPTQAKKFALMLEDGGFQVEVAERLMEGMQRIKRGDIDALLLDLTLPDSEGLQTFLTARSLAPDTPLVVLTNVDDESLAATTLRQGAQDYLVKGEVNQNWLVRSVQHAIARRVHRPAEEKPRAEAEHQAKQTIDINVLGPVTLVRFLEKRLLDAGDIALIGEKLLRLVDSGCRKLLVNFAEVDYVSNGALSALLAVRRRMLQAKGRIALCELSDNVLEHLSVRQFHKLFDILADEKSAIEKLESE